MTHLKTRDAYRGYSLQLNQIYGVWYISKDGQNVGSAVDLESARVEIDRITTTTHQEVK